MSPSNNSTAGITSDKLTLNQGKDTLPKEGPRCRRLPTVKENTNRQGDKLVTEIKTPPLCCRIRLFLQGFPFVLM